MHNALLSVDNGIVNVSLAQLNKSYLENCKSTQVPAVGMLEFTSMCGVLSDQVEMRTTAFLFFCVLQHYSLCI